MAGTATFNVGEVRKLFDHSKAAPSHSADYEHLFDPKFHKGGVVLTKDGNPYKEGNGWPDSNNIDLSLIPAALSLVGDQGVYLMSNGNPRLLIEEGKSANVVAYAKESDPTSGADFDDWYEAKRRIFGGDDGSVPLPLEVFEEVMQLPDTATFKIKISSRSVSVIVPKERAKPIKLADGMLVKTKDPLKFNGGFTGSCFRVTGKAGVFMAMDDKGAPLHLVRIDPTGLCSLIRRGAAEIIPS